MVIPRPRASSLSKVNVCSPKATMTLYDIFLHATGFSNFLDFTVLGSFELPCGMLQGAKHIRIPHRSRRLFAHFFETLRLEQDICYDMRRKKPEPFVLAELDGRVLCRE